jgi:hypothetical protein
VCNPHERWHGHSHNLPQLNPTRVGCSSCATRTLIVPNTLRSASVCAPPQGRTSTRTLSWHRPPPCFDSASFSSVKRAPLFNRRHTGQHPHTHTHTHKRLAFPFWVRTCSSREVSTCPLRCFRLRQWVEVCRCHLAPRLRVGLHGFSPRACGLGCVVCFVCLYAWHESMSDSIRRGVFGTCQMCALQPCGQPRGPASRTFDQTSLLVHSSALSKPLC